MAIEQQNDGMKSMIPPLLLAGILLIFAGPAYYNFAPKSYRATARIKVEKTGWADAQGKGEGKSADSELAHLEAKLIDSDVILDEVIKNLYLPILWKNRPGNSSSSSNAIRAELKAKLDIRPEPKSAIVAINVTSPDRPETAIIANELVRVYQAYRRTERHTTIDGQFGVIQKQLDEENRNVDTVRRRVEAFSKTNYLSRTADNRLIVGSDRYDFLQKKKKELVKDIALRQQEIDRLKATEKREMRLGLASSDPDKNSRFNVAYAKLQIAERELTQARIVNGDNSAEVKHAREKVEILDKQISQITDGFISFKQTDLAGIQAGLNQINTELKTATTNSSVVTASSQIPAWEIAKAELQAAINKRDALQEKLAENDAVNAVMRVSIKSEVIESAEVPTVPFSPDRRTALVVISCGACFLILGMVLWLTSRKKNSPTLRP